MFAWWLLWFLPLSCSYEERWSNACDEAISFMCLYQVSCSLTASQKTCESQLRAEFICNPDSPLADFRECNRVAQLPDCAGTIPDECAEVLCSRELGCSEDPPESGLPASCLEGTPNSRPENCP